MLQRALVSCSVVLQLSLSCFFAISLVTCHVEGDQLGGSVDLLGVLGEQVNEQFESDPFALESLPTDVRLATRGTSETFVDSVHEKKGPRVDSATSWPLEFSTELKRNIDKPVSPLRDEFGLMPSPADFFDERKDTSDDVRVAALPQEPIPNEELLDSVIENDDPNKLQKTLPVRPEPSGLSMMLMCLVSLILVGSCTRLLRPLREEPIEMFRR